MKRALDASRTAAAAMSDPNARMPPMLDGIDGLAKTINNHSYVSPIAKT